jgi:hypothetical protein
LTESTLLSGCGIADAVEAGAEQVIVVSGAAENPSTPLRRRGPRALAEATLETLERHGFERELAEIERASRMIETLGHRTEGGGRAWQDPATGRVYRDVSVYVVRPQARALRPFDHVGALDPVTEVVETPEDLIERGYQDAFQLFIEPVVGGAPAPRRYVEDVEEGAPAEL